MTDEDDRQWRGKETELLLVNSEVDKELADFARRDSSMMTRGTILVGAAGVVGALQLGDGLQPWSVVHLVLTFLAAVAGVVVVFPRSGKGFNPATLKTELLKGTSGDEALHHMTRVKLDNLEADDKWLSKRSWFARAGFILLTLGVLAAAVAPVFPAGPASPTPVPTVAVTFVP